MKNNVWNFYGNYRSQIIDLLIPKMKTESLQNREGLDDHILKVS